MRSLLLVSALSMALATPALAQQGRPNTGTVNMGNPQTAPQANVWRRPGGGQGRGFNGGGGGRAFNGGGGGRGWQGGGGRDGGWRGDGWRHRHHGSALGLGLGGLAAGAIIGGAIASQPAYGYGYSDPGYAAPDGDYVDTVSNVGGDSAYCAQRFKSYDVASGTYLGYDGLRHPCP